ncbi:MAG: UDP-glucose 4-epimerase [Phycisphaeraceae bacterium]|nr:UDP-glucose 4-epimerase [Phycisphaeraceae bacterium]
MKRILITGGTGVIGSALVPEALRDPGTTVDLLIRADGESHLEERLRRLFGFWQFDPDGGLDRQRVTAHRGDVCAEQFGLDAARYDKLARSVTHVVHCAGNVRMNQSLDDAKRDAVGSAEQILAFCDRAAGAGAFSKLEYVSTVGVAGRTAGTVPERFLDAPPGFHNTYENAKWEAEEILRSGIGQGLAATIHRPSMVVGDSRSGRVRRFQVFYYLAELFTGHATWGFVPATGDARLDLVPCDYVARAIMHCCDDADSAGRVLHHCSGPDGAAPISELSVQLREMLAPYRRSQKRVRVMSHKVLRGAIPLIALLVPPAARRRLKALPYFLDYLDETQTFTNTESRRYFDQAGIALPSINSYLGAVVKYYCEMTFGQVRQAA